VRTAGGIRKNSSGSDYRCGNVQVHCLKLAIVAWSLLVKSDRAGFEPQKFQAITLKFYFHIHKMRDNKNLLHSIIVRNKWMSHNQCLLLKEYYLDGGGDGDDDDDYDDLYYPMFRKKF
jgi:hypothetical protein